jgi:hypothetical protein
MHEVINDIYNLAKDFMQESGLAMQPGYVVNQTVSLVLGSRVEDVSGVRMSEAFLVRMQYWHTDYGKRPEKQGSRDWSA